MFGSIVVLFFLPWLDTMKVKSARYRPLYKIFFALYQSGLPGFIGGIIFFFDIIFFLTSSDNVGFFGGIINSLENEYEPKIKRKIKINLINILKKIIFL